jgi:hypothetical protein
MSIFLRRGKDAEELDHPGPEGLACVTPPLKADIPPGLVITLFLPQPLGDGLSYCVVTPTLLGRRHIPQVGWMNELNYCVAMSCLFPSHLRSPVNNRRRFGMQLVAGSRFLRRPVNMQHTGRIRRGLVFI